MVQKLKITEPFDVLQHCSSLKIEIMHLSVIKKLEKFLTNNSIKFNKVDEGKKNIIVDDPEKIKNINADVQIEEIETVTFIIADPGSLAGIKNFSTPFLEIPEMQKSKVVLHYESLQFIEINFDEVLKQIKSHFFEYHFAKCAIDSVTNNEHAPTKFEKCNIKKFICTTDIKIPIEGGCISTFQIESKNIKINGCANDMPLLKTILFKEKGSILSNIVFNIPIFLDALDDKHSFENVSIKFDYAEINNKIKDDAEFKKIQNTFEILAQNPEFQSEKGEIQKYRDYFKSREDLLSKCLYCFHGAYTKWKIPCAFTIIPFLLNIGLVYYTSGDLSKAVLWNLNPFKLITEFIFVPLDFQLEFSYLKFISLILSAIVLFSFFCLVTSLRRIYGFQSKLWQ